MSQPEFLNWIEFHRLFPFDDLHRLHRPAALAATPAGDQFNERLQARLDWLQPQPRDESDLGHQYSEADLNTFKAFGFKPPKRK